MRYLNSNLAREVGRLIGWSDGIWSRRYQAILVSGEEGAQISRLKYVLPPLLEGSFRGYPENTGTQFDQPDRNRSRRPESQDRRRASRGGGDPGPTSAPSSPAFEKSPAPLFHTVSQAVRRELYEGYAWFVAAFRQAAEKLKAGDRNAAFPTGSFPPALPFVGG